MKKDTHPNYQTITIKCVCGHSFQVGSTSSEDIEVEICTNCHPFYTGKSKLIDTARRIDKFQARQEKTTALKRASMKKKTTSENPDTQPR